MPAWEKRVVSNFYSSCTRNSQALAGESHAQLQVSASSLLKPAHLNGKPRICAYSSCGTFWPAISTGSDHTKAQCSSQLGQHTIRPKPPTESCISHVHSSARCTANPILDRTLKDWTVWRIGSTNEFPNQARPRKAIKHEAGRFLQEPFQRLCGPRLEQRSLGML